MTTLELDPTQLASMRDRAFEELRDALPPGAFAAAVRCSAKLAAALPSPGQLDANLVMVAFGGGKDSAYTVAFVRAMQLVLFRLHGTTFRLRVATNRHAGMPRAVLDNITRVYQALRLTGDSGCELLLIDGPEVSAFDPAAPQRGHVVRRNRLDILMSGHRTFGDGRPTFCNACNFSVVNSFGIAAAHGPGADVIITGDSLSEQRAYAVWVGRLARTLQVGRPAPDQRAHGQGQGGISRFLTALDSIAQTYFTEIHGPGAGAEITERRIMADVPERLKFFSIYSDTGYAAGDHMRLLTGFLGFRFDDFAFSFTESDCGNPALMAHLRGLRAERVFQRSYADGMAEYVAFAVELMRKKDYPPELIELMRGRYAGPDAGARMRRAANEYAQATFGLTEEHLVCLVYSPFAGAGQGLAQFLDREQPGLADRVADIHLLLAGGRDSDQELARALGRISGLELPQLRVLYASPEPSPRGHAGGVIGAVLTGDPHKAIISTRHAHDGPPVAEQISGR